MAVSRGPKDPGELRRRAEALIREWIRKLRAIREVARRGG